MKKIHINSQGYLNRGVVWGFQRSLELIYRFTELLMHFLNGHIRCAFGSSWAVSQHYQSRWGMQIVSAETSSGQLLLPPLFVALYVGCKYLSVEGFIAYCLVSWRLQTFIGNGPLYCICLCFQAVPSQRWLDCFFKKQQQGRKAQVDSFIKCVVGARKQIEMVPGC